MRKADFYTRNSPLDETGSYSTINMRTEACLTVLFAAVGDAKITDLKVLVRYKTAGIIFAKQQIECMSSHEQTTPDTRSGVVFLAVGCSTSCPASHKLSWR